MRPIQFVMLAGLLMLSEFAQFAC